MINLFCWSRLQWGQHSLHDGSLVSVCAGFSASVQIFLSVPFSYSVKDFQIYYHKCSPWWDNGLHTIFRPVIELRRSTVTYRSSSKIKVIGLLTFQLIDGRALYNFLCRLCESCVFWTNNIYVLLESMQPWNQTFWLCVRKSQLQWKVLVKLKFICSNY